MLEESKKIVRQICKASQRKQVGFAFSWQIWNQFNLMCRGRGISKTRALEILMYEELLAYGYDMKKDFPKWIFDGSHDTEKEKALDNPEEDLPI